MGWMDAPEVQEPTPGAASVPGAPPATGQSFTQAPEVQTGPTPTPEPTMGQVALNAIPKGMANLFNTPITLASLIMHGLANLPGAGHLQGLQEAAKSPLLQSNEPMDLMIQQGLVNPAMNPQTGPQRIVDTAIQSAIGAAAIPAGGVAGAVRGAVIGATSGAAAQTTKELTGSDLLAVAVGAGTPFAIRSLAESGKQLLVTPMQKATLKEAQQAGFKVEPSQVRQPTSKLESIAGKASIAQQANVENQALANQLAAKSLGLPENTPLSPALLEELKKKIGKVYEEVDALRASKTDLPWFQRYHSKNLVEELKQARQDATGLYKSYYRNPDQGVLKAAKAASAEAQSIENDIDMIAKAAETPQKVEYLYHGSNAQGAKDIEKTGLIGGHMEPLWLAENRGVAENYAKAKGGKVFAIRRDDFEKALGVHGEGIIEQLKQEGTTALPSFGPWRDVKIPLAPKEMPSSVQPGLLDRLKAARLLYARVNDIEKAMNVGSGNISMPVLGRMLDKGAPLSGELALIGRFQQAFPRVAREVEQVPPSGVSGTDAAMSAALSMGGAAATGSPLGVIAGGLPLARGPARSRVLSEAYQSGLLKEPTPPTPLSTTALRAGMVGKGQAQEGMEETPAP